MTRASIQEGPASIWRYGALLPDPGVAPVDLGAGWTPLRRATRLAEVLGVRELWLKDDTRNPTGSFKDRVVSVALSSARRLGFTTAACASTGNLATSVAAHAAFIGWPSVTIIPADLEKSKIAMTAIFGGTVLGVEGSYDDVNRLCVELVDEHPDWAFANINLRPFYSEGSKTLAFEIAEQLGWRTPDQVVVPVASGSQLTKVAKGFKEFVELGLVEGSAPVLFGAQATGCSPIATAFSTGADFITPQRPNTIARSLAIGNPADAPYVLDELRANGGDCGSVPDDEILECIELLAKTEGVFAETAGGVTIASLRQMINRGTIDREKSIVAIISGHGLKTLDAIVDSATVSSTISPSLEAAEEALRFHQLVAAS
ncbi:MAG TPA: threonine synthase [Acidimicrobiales bacterium]|nr:threonine synthase [Acidimicrobiales bacterium]